MNIHNILPAAARRRKLKLASSVAALTLMAVAGFEAGVAIPTMPAHAKTAEVLAQTSATPTSATFAPVSFADLVEKVKPAVISVKAKIVDQDTLPKAFGRNGDESEQTPIPNLPFMPRGEAPERFGEALGSGFFISADGYAVTNNHVVEKAKDVSIIPMTARPIRPKWSGPIPRPIWRCSRSTAAPTSPS